MAGRHYVGYSRFSSHLFVLDSAFEEIYVDPRVHAEMSRLRASSRPNRIFKGLNQTSNFPPAIQCVVHNTRSLVAHIDDIRSDDNLMAANLLVFTETRLRYSNCRPSLDLPLFLHDYGQGSTVSEPVNVLVYQKHYQASFLRRTVCLISSPDFTLRYDIFTLPDMSDELHLISVYRSPRPVSLRSFFQQLQNLLVLQQRFRLNGDCPLLISGDFNTDLLQDSAETRLEISLMQIFSLYQCVPVHTTDFGSLLDHVWTNISPSRLVVSVQKSFWSDHVPVLVTLAL
jgi:hypothetical protein